MVKLEQICLCVQFIWRGLRRYWTRLIFIPVVHSCLILLESSNASVTRKWLQKRKQWSSQFLPSSLIYPRKNQILIGGFFSEIQSLASEKLTLQSSPYQCNWIHKLPTLINSNCILFLSAVSTPIPHICQILPNWNPEDHEKKLSENMNFSRVLFFFVICMLNVEKVLADSQSGKNDSLLVGNSETGNSRRKPQALRNMKRWSGGWHGSKSTSKSGKSTDSPTMFPTESPTFSPTESPTCSGKSGKSKDSSWCSSSSSGWSGDWNRSRR